MSLKLNDNQPMAQEPKKRKKRTISLDVDLHADLTGFGSAQRPTDDHHKVAKHYSSPLLSGPPQSESLLEFVTHTFTDEEASLVAHIPPLRSRTAKRIARLAHRPVEHVERVLNNLAFNKIVIFGRGNPTKYSLLPIVPGTFEAVLMTTDLSTRNAWHKKFAVLFEGLWDTGYMADYVKMSHPPIRYLPANSLKETLYSAWPSDHLEELLEPYDLFAVGNCQCRTAMALAGKGCGRPTENCTVYGPIGQTFIDRGMMRRIDRTEMIEIKRHAETKGCVTWMMNQGTDKYGSVSCSCCGCCCHALRSISEFSSPSVISKPHFMPVKVPDKCNTCKVCVTVCPTDAWSMVDDQLSFSAVRCVGCGLCVVSCKFDALELKPVEEARAPTGGWLSQVRRLAPGYVSTSLRVWAKRLIS